MNHDIAIQDKANMTESIGGEQAQPKTSRLVYILNPGKINTLDDMKRVLTAMSIVFPEGHPNLFLVRDLCNEQVISA